MWGGGPLPPVPSVGPATWDVFDPEGVWLGPVELPARFVPTSVRRDRIAGIHVSGLDVAHVRVHSLDGR